jgi:hypothetical protein
MGVLTVVIVIVNKSQLSRFVTACRQATKKPILCRSYLRILSFVSL